MLNTAFDKIIEHERACANLTAEGRRIERMKYKGEYSGEHSCEIPAHHGKLGESLTPQQTHIIAILEKKIDQLTQSLMSESSRRDAAMDELYSASRKVRELTEINERLSQSIKLERQINKDSQSRIDGLYDRLRRYVG